MHRRCLGDQGGSVRARFGHLVIVIGGGEQPIGGVSETAVRPRGYPEPSRRS